MGNIFEITKVETEIQKSNPPKLIIKAEGKVPTIGWINGKLDRRIYIEFPADGIQDFDFNAMPPPGVELPTVIGISAEDVWEDFPDYLKGVRVHSSTNSVVSLIAK
jgi:hypothetical protein